ncbi:MAG TPA: phytanoyl-CoA dioxygenase family protein [Caulobacteraceae bacterium]|jgi:hypothetical protein
MTQTPTTQDFTLSPEQREAFAQRGVIRLPGLLSAEAVRRAREAVLEPLARLGLWRDGAWRLGALPRPQWPATGLKTSKAIGNKRPEIEALLDEPVLLAAVDALLEGRPFDRRVFHRPQVLFTLPNIDAWRIPPGWHADGPRLASGMSPGVQMFACLDRVEAQGGGTLMVAGSHRLLNEAGRFLRARDLTQGLRREPFFRELFAGRASAADGLPRARIGDVPVEVIECVGAPGDGYLVDLRTLHVGAPNASDRPRMMVTHRFMRADVMREIAEAYGWTGEAEP